MHDGCHAVRSSNLIIKLAVRELKPDGRRRQQDGGTDAA